MGDPFFQVRIHPRVVCFQESMLHTHLEHHPEGIDLVPASRRPWMQGA